MKKENKKDRRINIVFLVLAAVFFLLGIFLILYSNHDIAKKFLGDYADDIFPIEEEKKKEDVNERPYAFETTYTGEEDLPSELFKYPFKESEGDDFYICNKELYPALGEERTDQIIETSKALFMTMFNVDYRIVSQNVDAYKKQLTDLTMHEYLLGLKMSDYGYFADEWTDWIIKNKLVLSCEVKTGRCMVFKDLGYRCRCAVYVTPHLGELVDISKEVGYMVHRDSEYLLILDTDFDYNSWDKVFTIRPIDGSFFPNPEVFNEERK